MKKLFFLFIILAGAGMVLAGYGQQVGHLIGGVLTVGVILFCLRFLRI